MKNSFYIYIVIILGVVSTAHANDDESSLTLDLDTETKLITSIGYIAGYADGCNVAQEKSNMLFTSMAIAIDSGHYGDKIKSSAMLNTARQNGATAALSHKVDCGKLSDLVNAYTSKLQSLTTIDLSK